MAPVDAMFCVFQGALKLAVLYAFHSAVDLTLLYAFHGAVDLTVLCGFRSAVYRCFKHFTVPWTSRCFMHFTVPCTGALSISQCQSPKIQDFWIYGRYSLLEWPKFCGLVTVPRISSKSNDLTTFRWSCDVWVSGCFGDPQVLGGSWRNLTPSLALQSGSWIEDMAGTSPNGRGVSRTSEHLSGLLLIPACTHVIVATCCHWHHASTSPPTIVGVARSPA
ncbi:hypothetical protein METBIDRAFT_113718 [Metschnikowia bicuspidata var. bicuspidata NRRL YB-4993]|uniref:Uncharacterized protein n=1 Tax=Metschnikowia bicuspidata var. bicuspidata NRRL YB-4993 TaxID=869754 RepID=A0A1A0HIX2_9ASCO|nr:hypothetical protein METBIDRAFT_113718 [Metschnikowia bicuspidata var. bicuspidata NRRL YB-4993]OBA23832.1 hypothetical protein METBIDRAFT_113718 [Metschnikowia bicuspidata var. bicuspidata NRRL YB-4993]